MASHVEKNLFFRGNVAKIEHRGLTFMRFSAAAINVYRPGPQTFSNLDIKRLKR